MGFFDRFRNKNKPESSAVTRDVLPEPAAKEIPEPAAEAVPVQSGTQPESELVPLVGRIPFPAYRGTEPYIFISYAHANADEVFAQIKQFHDQGYRIWYDEGIAPGNEWTDEIANALENASLFLVFLTPESEKSTNVRDEINYALNDNKPFLAIHLKETQLTGGLKLRVGTKQAILKYTMTEEEYLYKYTFAFEHLGLPVPPAILKYKEAYSPAKPAQSQAVLTGKHTGDPSAQKQTAIPAAPQKAPGAAVPAHSGFRPKGTAVITTKTGSRKAPANSLFSMAANGIFLHPKTRWTQENGELPEFAKIRKINMEPYPDNNEYHRLFHITLTDGSVIDTDVQTSFSWLGFEEEGHAAKFPWHEVDSIDIDWSSTLSDDWSEYARVHLRGGDVLFVPAFSLTMAGRRRPGPDSASYNSNLTWPETIKTRRGTDVSLRDLSSASFGAMVFEEDRWEKDWFKEIPIGLVYKDGRQMSTFLQEDYLKFFAIDDFGVVEILPDKLDHIDFVKDIAEEVFHAELPVSQAAAAAPQTSAAAPSSVLSSEKKHTWGDYEPKGTAYIYLKDGRELKGIANSFVLKAKRMEKQSMGNERLYTGMDTPDLEHDYDLSNMKPFLEMNRIENTDDGFLVTDMDEEETRIRLPQGCEFWFLGEENKFEPGKLMAEDVRLIEFKRREDAGIPVRFCTVSCKEGSFLSPAAFLTISYNAGSGIPSMKLCHDFSKYAGYPVKVKNLQRLLFIKQGSGGMYPGFVLKAELKNGEDIDFEMNGYFSILVMARFGTMRDIPRASFRGIEF